MESIKDVIRKISGGKSPLGQSEQMLKELLEDEHVLEFLKSKEGQGITRSELLKNVPKLYQFANERHHCRECPGLKNCPNMMQGFRPDLVNDKESLNLTFSPCSLKIAEDMKQKQRSLIKSFYVPKDILKADFQSFIPDIKRKDSILAAGEFIKGYLDSPKDVKGLYLYGKFGVGKTYLAGAIVNELAKRKGISSMLVYTPDFFREMRQSIQDGTVDEKLETVKEVPVLVLDDIGAETMTPWIRDDILGSILQYRMMESLPTIYTSNKDFDDLEAHLSYSDKSGEETLKAKRIMERIRYYTTFVQMEGDNRRGS
ncbi:primosomal protein DnaI [Terrilactibacillus laevilacticus]|uniref:Primosomal protein DnaI n=1 Tax=Terrilactibacillus laevilacticus TaxID=1380157 RepID=A0ABW5PTH1_9BACI|nr:primosomal protein DnaI [Terrilactibacillus laevilacticus]